jgi:hypothetical protein
MKNLLKKSRNGNYYYIQPDGTRVMVNETLVPKWNEITAVTTAERLITQTQDGSPLPTDQHWSLVEVVAYESQIEDLATSTKLEVLKVESEFKAKTLRQEYEIKLTKLAKEIEA